MHACMHACMHAPQKGEDGALSLEDVLDEGLAVAGDIDELL